jgi:hypothetical protein
VAVKRRTILAYVLSPVLGYPLYFLVANAIDSLFGDRRLVQWLLFDSRRELLEIFLDDWAHSLPAMLAVSLGLIMPVHALLARFGRLSIIRFGGLVSTIMLVASWVVGFSPNGIAVNTLTALLLAALVLAVSKSGRRGAAAR